MFKLCSLLQLEGAQGPCLIRFIKSLTVWKPCSCQQYWCLHRDIGARRAYVSDGGQGLSADVKLQPSFLI